MNSLRARSLLGRAACLLATIVLLAGWAAAASWPYYDDPNSTIVWDGSTFGGPNNNDLTQTYTIGSLNFGHDILFALTAWNNANPGAAAWNQGLGGWYGNVNGTTVLVTVPNVSLMPWSQVANSTGLQQETYTVFGQTVGPPNAYPTIDLGYIAAGGSVTIQVTEHFAWGDGRPGISFSRYWDSETLAPNPWATPEPSTLVLLGSAALGFAGIVRRHRKL